MTARSALCCIVVLAWAASAPPARASDPSDCAGLAPPGALPPPLELTVEGAGGPCEVAGTDGAGDFVLERIGTGVVDLHFFSADGRATGTRSFSGNVLPQLGPSAFLGQANGYLVSFFDFDPQRLGQVLVGLGPDGTTRGQMVVRDPNGRVEQHLVIGDPRGGAVVVDVLSAAAGPDSPWSIAVRRVSPSGDSIDDPHVIETGSHRVPTLAAHVARDGSLLLATAGHHFPRLRNNQLAGRWFDASNVPITPWFVTLDQVVGETGSIFDGGQRGPVVSLGERRAVVPTRAGSAEPAPAWIPAYLPSLVQLPDRMAIVSSTNEPCANRIEVLAPSGNLCGSVDVPAPFRNGFCQSSLSLTIGRDGTVLQRTSNDDVCAVRWWRRLLQ